MSVKNDFKAFSAGNNANVVSQGRYEESKDLLTGFPPDDVPTHLLNKVLRQSSTIASVVANFIAEQSGEDVLDNGDITKLTAQLSKAFYVSAKRVGDIYLSAHPASDLAKGEYIANGAIHEIDSTVGRALNNLSDAYKAAWGIKQNGKKINLPNLFVDGRGIFVRAGLQPGVIQRDAIRNIQGDVGWWATGLFSRVSGAFYGVKASNNASAHHKEIPDQYSIFSYATFDASKVVPTADENRPLNVSMIPVIYLGV
ncbi:phage tail protein [Photorhabdus luminescens]|uniref:Phage tail protein n=1 Tax=Photorhabdus luminescens subsp. mexicana TaxID=2100167 RepID=A0A4R4JRU4_PHOLU|nr:phage tail protein [Photorhabdus luminescens]TDB56169.1 phage tail protein [Photorhabdus luminescens subsp. mexicana]